MSILSSSELKQFQEKGWEITTTNDKKVRYRHPESGTLFFSPSKHQSSRAEKNLRAALRRPLRELENRPTDDQPLQLELRDTRPVEPSVALPARRYPISKAESEQNTATVYWTQDAEIDRATAVASWCLCYLGLRAGSHPIPAINASRDRFRFDASYRARVVETFLKMDDADFRALRARNRERFAGVQRPPVVETRTLQPTQPREPQQPLSLPRAAALPAVAPTPPGLRAELVKLSEGLEHERRMRRVSAQTQAELQRKIERALARMDTVEARVQHWQEEVEERIKNMTARLAEPVRQVVPPPAAPVLAAPAAPAPTPAPAPVPAPAAKPAAAAPAPVAEPALAVAAERPQARDRETVGQKLYRARDARSMTQREAGAMFGVAGVTYLFWEKDRHPVPEHRQDTLEKFLSVLGEPSEPAEDRVAVRLPGRTIGDRIRNRRTELGLSQGDVGERIGKTGSAVGHWESGRANPRLDMFEPLAVALHTTERALLGPKA